MTDENVTSRPDVSEMRSVHGVFRDTLDTASKLVTAVDPLDTSRRTLIANFFENVVLFLHAHHETEEELVFPLLRERCPDQLATVERAAEQHEEVLDRTRRAEASLSSWNKGEDDSQQRCADDLIELGNKLASHLDEEESQVLPLCAEHLSVAEWSALPGHGMAIFQGDKIWLILGLIRQRMTQSQRDEMLTHMPPPAVEMWTGFGERAFGELIAAVGPPIG